MGENGRTSAKKFPDHENVWYTTNIDYVNYMTAARNLIFNAECTLGGEFIQNRNILQNKWRVPDHMIWHSLI